MKKKEEAGEITNRKYKKLADGSYDLVSFDLNEKFHGVGEKL